MKKEYVKRYFYLCIGLLIMAFGVAFSIRADLGTSPISSVPYVESIVGPLTVGMATIVMHCVFIFLQIVILRRRYDPVQLMQLPVALIFGMMTDLAVQALQGVTYSSVLTQWLLCIIGIVLVATGVSIEVLAGVVTLAGEGLVLAVCKVVPVKFSSMKVCFDVTLVVIAIAIGLIFKGTFLGVGAGTVAAAVFVGILSRGISRPVGKLMHMQRLKEA